MKPANCRRFQSILSEGDFEALSTKDSHFFEDHKLNCEPCRVSLRAQVIGLDLLRGASTQVEQIEISSHFEDAVVRNLKIQSKRDSWSYWWPAGLGAAIASLAAFAAMQLVSGSSSFKPILYRGQQARNSGTEVMRSLSTVREYNR